MDANSNNAAFIIETMTRNVRVIAAACVLAAISALTPATARSQERLKIIYSQFTMTNSVSWFAREAGLFERHGLMADLVYVDSTPAVQALTAGQAPVATMSGGLALGPYLNGLDLVMLAGWCNFDSYQLVTRPEIRRPEDLRNKVIGIGRFGAAAAGSRSRYAVGRSGLSTTTSASTRSPSVVTTARARPPATSTRATSVPYRKRTPCFSAAPASARGTACIPPTGK